MASVQTILDFFNKPLEEDVVLGEDNEADELYTLCDDPMQIPIKLVDGRLCFTDISDLQNLFVENTGFLVVGVVGLQGSGKSSVLNILANRLSSNSVLFNGPFPTQSVENVVQNFPETIGIDLYITQDRVILLDTQPLLSWALTNYHAQQTKFRNDGGPLEMASFGSRADSAIRSDLSHGFGPAGWSLDVWAEMSSIQIVSFLLNVCHVVVVVQNELSTTPTNLYRILDQAAGLKPTMLTPCVIPHPVKCTSREESNVRNRKVQASCTTVQRGTKMQEAPVIKPSKQCIDAQNIVSRFGEELEDDIESPDLLQTPQQRRIKSLELESSDVTDALTRLRKLTDYSASLVHVYNQAPSAVYLDAVICERLDRFQKRVLPSLLPEYRRLISLVGLGPQILSSHLAARSRDCLQTDTIISPPKLGITRDKNATGNRPTRIETENRSTRASAVENMPEQSNSDDFLDPTCSPLVFDGNLDSDNQVTSCPSETTGPPLIEEHAFCDPVDPLDFQSDLPEDGVADDTFIQSNMNVAEQNSNSNSALDSAAISDSNIRCGSKVNMLPDTDLCSSMSRLELEECNGSGVHVSSTNSVSPPPKIEVTDQSSRPSEKQIVAECCSLIRQIEHELNNIHLHPAAANTKNLFAAADYYSSSDSSSSCSNDEGGSNSDELDGELLNAKLSKMARRVQYVRQQFFDLHKRLNQPRLFLLPELDESNSAPTGCPSYAASIYALQEAILSTPRQHMSPHLTEKKWISYACKMWDAIRTSPLLMDYHSVLTNNL